MLCEVAALSLTAEELFRCLGSLAPRSSAACLEADLKNLISLAVTSFEDKVAAMLCLNTCLPSSSNIPNPSAVNGSSRSAYHFIYVEEPFPTLHSTEKLASTGTMLPDFLSL